MTQSSDHQPDPEPDPQSGPCDGSGSSEHEDAERLREDEASTGEGSGDDQGSPVLDDEGQPKPGQAGEPSA